MTDVTLTRDDGRKDVIPVSFPSLPVRAKLFQAYRTATGYREDDTEPSAEPNADDVAAILAAALGLSWAGPSLPNAPNFRDLGRDAIEFGERFVTAAHFGGYQETAEIYQSGSDCFRAMTDELVNSHRQATLDFPKAPKVQT